MRRSPRFLWLALLLTSCTAEDPVHGLVPHGDPRDAGAPVDANVPPDTTCASIRLGTSAATPNVVLLVDRSASMGDVFDRGLSRWQVLQSAIIGSPGGLVPRLQSTVRFGLAIFDGAATCPELLTVLPPALEDDAMIDATYRSVGPNGGTPTGAALTALVARLSRTSEPPGPTVVVLATDGEPNDCVAGATPARGQMLAVAAAANAHAAGYTVDAIGVATDVALANLQQVATAGGGTAVSVSDTATLVAALDDLVRGVTSCTLALSGTIDLGHACEGTVTLNGVPLTCGGRNGWHPVDAGHIALDGTSCDALQHPPADVSATFPCTVVLDPTH